MPTIGEQLKQEREKRKLTLQKAAQVTRIRQYYIEAMEQDDFSVMPSPVQGRGFLRLYADFLGLNADELIARQRADTNSDAVLPANADSAESAPAPVLPLPVPDTTPAPDPALLAEPEPEAATEEIQPQQPFLSEGVAPSIPPRQSQTIFAEIGAQLQQRRELLSLTLVEIERHTHVRKHYLTAIEAGSFDDLPSPVQARGMLNAYAKFLDMDAESLLLRYADALQMRRMEMQPAESKPVRARKTWVPDWLRNFLSPDLIFGGLMLVAILALVLWGANHILASQAAPEATQGPSISDVILATPSEFVATEDARPTSLAELTTPIPGNQGEATATVEGTLETIGGVQVTVIVRERTFLRVIVDGEVRQDGRVAPGAALTFDGNAFIEVLTGNGSAIQIIYNQSDQGVMGSFGQVVDRIYTISEIQTPTPTISPTPTLTPRVTPTRTPTVTPTISETESSPP